MIEDAPRDPELALSLVHVPAPARPAMEVLFRLDDRLGAIVSEPNRPIAAIKLAWWREALARLDSAPPPPEPLLRTIAERLLPAGLTGADLAAIAGGWDALIDDDEDSADAADGEPTMLARHARERGGGLFAAAARLLGGDEGCDVRAAGEAWALALLPPPHAAAARSMAWRRMATIRHRWPRRLRALGVLTVLARDRLRREDARAGSPRRVARALWHALSGW